VYTLNTSGVWSNATLPSPTIAQAPNGVYYGNGTFLITGSSNTCMWSSTNNGSTWSVTNYTSGTYYGQSTYTTSRANPFYCNGAWQMPVSGGSSPYTHAILTSSNGTSWSVGGTITTSVTTDALAGTWATNAAQTAALGWGNWSGAVQYYSTAVNSASQSHWIPSPGNYYGGAVAWIPDQNAFMVTLLSGTYVVYVPVSQMGTGPGTPVVATTASLGSSIGVLSTSKPSIIAIASDVAASATHPISFDGGNTWTTTTLPSAPGTGEYIGFTSFNGQMFAWTGATDHLAFVGTPA
jgi:hypothetical protein